MPDERGSMADQLIQEFRAVPEAERLAWLQSRLMSSWLESEGYGSRLGLADWAASWHSLFAELERGGILQPPERKFVDALFEYVEWLLGKELELGD
jgi:hypothetical protein